MTDGYYWYQPVAGDVPDIYNDDEWQVVQVCDENRVAVCGGDVTYPVDECRFVGPLPAPGPQLHHAFEWLANHCRHEDHCAALTPSQPCTCSFAPHVTLLNRLFTQAVK